MKIQKFLSVLIALAVAVLMINPVHASGYWEKNIDILVVEDEEFAGLWQGFKNEWYWYFTDALDYYYCLVGAPMIIRGTVSWDSNDNCHDPYYLLQEAIQETGYKRHMYYNGYYIDLLVVFTAQEMDMAGFSPPDWYALIIKHSFLCQEIIITHELGHQFNLPHCENILCVMCPNAISSYLCSSCLAKAVANYPTRFWRWVEVPSYSRRRGGGGGLRCFLV